MILSEQGIGNLSNDHALWIGQRYTSKTYSCPQQPEINTQSQDRHYKQPENQENGLDEKNHCCLK